MANIPPDFDVSDFSNANGPITTKVDGPDVRSDTLAKLKGNTDGTWIGNVGDSLKVTSTDPGASAGVAVYSNKYRFDKASPDLTLTPTYQTVFSYTGTGKFISTLIDFDKPGADIRLTIDTTNVIFELNADFLNSIQPSTGSKGDASGGIGWDSTKDILVFEPGFPILYTVGYLIEARKLSGPTTKVSNWLVTSTKES